MVLCWCPERLARTAVIFTVILATLRTDLPVVMDAGFLLAKRHHALSCREQFLYGENVGDVHVVLKSHFYNKQLFNI